MMKIDRLLASFCFDISCMIKNLTVVGPMELYLVSYLLYYQPFCIPKNLKVSPRGQKISQMMYLGTLQFVITHLKSLSDFQEIFLNT